VVSPLHLPQHQQQTAPAANRRSPAQQPADAASFPPSPPKPFHQCHHGTPLPPGVQRVLQWFIANNKQWRTWAEFIESFYTYFHNFYYNT